jgi:hypothetical protein
MSTGNDNGKAGTTSLDDMVMLSAGRDFAKQYGGDGPHGDWLNQQRRLVGPPSTKVNLPNGDVFDTVSLTSKVDHRIATNSLNASVVAMSSQSSKRPRLYPDPSPAPRSRHQIPASVSGLARPQFPDFVPGIPAAAAAVTPSAASKRVYDLSHDSLLSPSLDRLSVSPRTAKCSPHVKRSSHRPVDPYLLLKRMENRSLKKSGAIKVTNIDNGEETLESSSSIARLPHMDNERDLSRYRTLVTATGSQREVFLNFAENMTDVNPVVSSQDANNAFDVIFPQV